MRFSIHKKQICIKIIELIKETMPEDAKKRARHKASKIKRKNEARNKK